LVTEGKHVNNTRVIARPSFIAIEKVLGEVFSVGSARVEAESNTSTVALRIVGGDEKGSLESETVKYVRESHGTRTRE
jgi:hypothetical protein